MRARAAAPLSFVVAFVLAVAACSPSRPATPPSHGAAKTSLALAGKPRLTVVPRNGDPAIAVGLALDTASIGESTPEASVALAALLGERLAPLHGVAHAGWDTVHAYALADSRPRAAEAVAATFRALTATVTAEEAQKVAKRIAKLADLPPVTPETAAAFACTNLPRPSAKRENRVWDATAIEKLRQAAVTADRVKISVVGDPAAATDAIQAYRDAPVLPGGGAGRSAHVYPPSSAATIPLAVSERAARTAPRVILAIASPGARELASAATRLAAPDGDLALRLASLAPPAKLERAEVALHGDHACLAIEASFAGEAPGRGAAAATATTEAAAAIAVLLARAATEERGRGGPPHAPLASDVARAAEEAAAWSFFDDDLRGEGAAYTVGELTPANDDSGAFARRVAELSQPRPVELRAQNEAGQSSTWLLLGSPCANAGETSATAGASALATLASTFATRAREDGVHVEPWTTAFGMGVLVRADGPDSGTRAARAAARTWLGGRPETHALAGARRYALGLRGRDEVLAFRTLADAVTPGELAAFMPFGTHDTLAALSEDAVNERLVALRRGPQRLCILESRPAGPTDADAALRIVSAFRDPLARANATCDARTPAPAVRPGTYALERTTPGPAELWVAHPVSNATPREQEAMELLATALDGRDGLLARALGEGIAHTTEARVVNRGGTDKTARPTLLIHVATSGSALDAAALRTTELLAQLARDAMSPAAVARTEETLAWNRRARLRDPRARLADLFTGASAAIGAGVPGKEPPFAPAEIARLAERVFRVEDRVTVALRARVSP